VEQPIFSPIIYPRVSPEWKPRLAAAAVNWPAGLGGKEMKEWPDWLKQTPGAIGYVELIYALQNKMDYAKCRE
jgi:phosphate transport system substrate-binding protein